MLMSTIEIFIWGFVGSFAVEIVALYEDYRSSQSVIPARYKQLGFWVVRCSLAIVAGTLAAASGFQHPLQSFGIGAAAPVMIKALTTATLKETLPTNRVSIHAHPPSRGEHAEPD
jgi:hypothetical protein